MNNASASISFASQSRDGTQEGSNCVLWDASSSRDETRLDQVDRFARAKSQTSKTSSFGRWCLLGSMLLAASTASCILTTPSHAQESTKSPGVPAADSALAKQQDALMLSDQATVSLEPEATTSNADALVISTDRPSFSDGTGFVPIGHFQLETGYTFTYRDRDDVETKRHNAPEILARVGLIADRLELRLSTAGYSWSRTEDGSGVEASAAEGWNDSTLGLKLKVADQSGWLPRLAIVAQSTLGIGSDGVSNQIAEPTLKLAWSYDLGQSLGDDWKGTTLGGNFNVAWPTTDGDRFTQGQGSMYFAFPVAEGLSGFVEYYVIGPSSKDGDEAHYVDFGGAYLLNNRIQLDARAGFGLNDEADNAFVGFGVSFLY